MRTSPAIIFFLILVFPHSSAGQQPQFCADANGCDLQVGPISLHVLAIPRVNIVTAPNSKLDVSNLTISIGGTAVLSKDDFPTKNDLSASSVAARINKLNRGVEAEVIGTSLIIRTTTSNAQKALSVTSLNSAPNGNNLVLRNFVLSVNAPGFGRLHDDDTRVSIRLPDGSLFHLVNGEHSVPNTWTYVSDRGPSDPGRLIVLQVDKDSTNCAKDWFAMTQQAMDRDSYGQFCTAQYVIVRRSENDNDESGAEKLVLGMKTTWNRQLEVYQQPITGSEYRIDERIATSGANEGELRIEPGSEPWLIEWIGEKAGCRAPSHDLHSPYYAAISVPPPEPTRKLEKNNGITVSPAKVFDTLTLRRMLNDTAAQLAGLSVFNAAQLSASVGNLQGIVRDTSYFSAQLTTAATPSINQSSSAGVATPNTTQTTVPVGATTVTLQCPDGSLPTIGSSTTLGGCATVPVSGTTPNVPAYAPVGGAGGNFQGTLTTTPAGSTVTNTGSTTNTQNGTTLNTPSVSGVAPTALTANPLTAPNNVGVASADILAEQVQLNAQLISLRLLLQGAVSDQFLTRNSTAVAMRRQTTLGFAITLDPPPQFRHAVAEVRVVIKPPSGLATSDNSVSLVRLLPSEKTYNVAKVTSHQNSFSGGAVVEPVSFGVSTGKTKDRLYLVKDTDTLALQFRPQAAPIGTPFPRAFHDKVKSVVHFEPLGVCDDTNERASDDALVFGWQFRPVLGQEYVTGGQRQVFAQLALPVDLHGQYAPGITVQTRWREYDPKRQVVGAVYKDSCSSERDRSGVIVSSRTHVDTMDLTDLGGGQLSLKANGQFYSSSLGIIAGANTLLPRLYDGRTLEIVASAHDLLQAGELSVVDPNGQTEAFSVVANPTRACNITQSSLVAVPYADGNSRVQLTLNLNSDYDLSTIGDGPIHPLVLIGDAVYGLKETPFQNGSNSPTCFSVLVNGGMRPGTTTTSCSYTFLAPTTALRNAQMFKVRDLTWKGFSQEGLISFSPSIATISPLSSSDPSQSTNSVTTGPALVGQNPARNTIGSGTSGTGTTGTGTTGTGTTGTGTTGTGTTGTGTTGTGTTGTTRGASTGGSSGPNLSRNISQHSTSKKMQPVVYAITGYDLSKIRLECTTNAGISNVGTLNPCLRVFAEDKELPLDAINFNVETDNIATMTLQQDQLKAKAIRFELDRSDDASDKMQWIIAIPKKEADSLVASPAFLRVGDSGKVSFSGKGLCQNTKTYTVVFEKIPLTATCTAASLDVMVTTDVTKLFGRKELVISAVGVPVKTGDAQVTLPIDVLKQ